jgi:hypothetical protein
LHSLTITFHRLHSYPELLQQTIKSKLENVYSVDWRDEFQEILDAKPFDLEIRRKMGRKIPKIELDDDIAVGEVGKSDHANGDEFGGFSPSQNDGDLEGKSASSERMDTQDGEQQNGETETKVSDAPNSAQVLSESTGSVTVSSDWQQEQPLGFIAVALSYSEMISRYLAEASLRVKVFL